MSKVHQRHWIKRVIIGLAIVFLPLLISLGFWQLNRAEQKQTLLADWSEASVLTALPEGRVTSGSRLKVSGHFIPAPYYLLDNKIREGQVGYEVVALFQVSGQSLLLVNLGWIASPLSRDRLPEITLPFAELNLQGRLIMPTPHMQLAKDAWSGERAIRIQQLDMSRLMQRHSGLYPALLRLEQPVLSQLKVGWPVVTLSPQRHIGYAVQWFGLALVLFTGCLMMYRDNRGRTLWR